MTVFGASCPHCETLFKVYPDQLRLHNGFANCGSCGRTFDVQAVLVVLPRHETTFLERNTPFVDGLPVLNAVAHPIRRHLANNAAAAPMAAPPLNANDASPSVSTTASEPPSPLNSASTPEIPKDEPADESIHSEKIKSIQIPDLNQTLNLNTAQVENPRPGTFKPIKWLLYFILFVLILVAAFAMVQPEEARALMHILRQKITPQISQMQPLAEPIAAIQPILSALGIHG